MEIQERLAAALADRYAIEELLRDPERSIEDACSGIIAAIPTFIIFVFCQNIIMRGIVVPVEK